MSTLPSSLHVGALPAPLPACVWGYSLAIDVPGAATERICDQSLDEAVEARVTGPVGMVDTAFFARDVSRLAAPYANGAPAPRRICNVDVVSAFGGAVGIRYAPARALDAEAFPSGGAGMVGSAKDVLHLLGVLRELPGTGRWGSAFYGIGPAKSCV